MRFPGQDASERLLGGELGPGEERFPSDETCDIEEHPLLERADTSAHSA